MKISDIRIEDFNYDLPDERIAKYPLPTRDASKLLLYRNGKPEEKRFVEQKRDLTDFKIGLVIPGKLLPKRIHGGVLLVDTTYEMR